MRGISRAEREEAMRVLREKQARAREGLPRDADGRPLLSEDEAAFDAEMAMAMGQDVSYGNGAEVDNLEAAGTPIVMERELVPGSSEALLAAREAEEARSWEERGQYYGNPDPKARGLVPTYNQETGEVGYSVAYPMPNEAGEIPTGAPGRPGQRPDLRRPVIDTATGQPIQGSHKYDKQLRDGPDGLVEVYAPSPEFQAELQEREDRNRTRRLATRAGYAPMQAAEMATSGEPQNLDQLRAMGDARRDAEKADRQQAVIRRAQARYNPLEYMNRGDISEWNRMVAADSVLRRPYRGATPLDVDQATQQAIALQEQRRAIGEGFQPRTPEETQMIKDKAAADQRKNDPATAGMRDIQGGNFESDEARAVLLNVAKPYDTNWLGGAPATAMPAIKKRLMDPPYNLPEAQAEVAAREAMRQTNWW